MTYDAISDDSELTFFIKDYDPFNGGDPEPVFEPERTMKPRVSVEVFYPDETQEDYEAACRMSGERVC